MRPFLPADLEEMNGWGRARGLPEVDAAELPALGVIVPGVACGFLIRTEVPGLALLDGLVTAPGAPLRSRYAAAEAITRALIGIAQDQGVRRLLAITRSRGVARIAVRCGMRVGGSGLWLLEKE